MNTDGVGAVISRYDYHPLAIYQTKSPPATAGGTDNDCPHALRLRHDPQTIHGQQARDGEAGLDFGGARMYNSMTAGSRFPTGLRDDTDDLEPPTHPMKSTLIRKVLLSGWGLLIVSGLVFYFLRPDLFSPDQIAAGLAKFQNEALIVFLAISIVRGFTLLPSTPLIIAGTLAFPTTPWTVLAISMIGIIVSSSLIFWFAETLGIAAHFEERKPAAVAKIRSRLEHPTGIAFVFLWAFFPLVPTDAVCYVAGSIRMQFAKFIAAITGGELILCSFYIFSGSYLIDTLW